MVTDDLVDLVVQDYIANGKRSVRAVEARRGNLTRLMPTLPRYRDVERYKATRAREGAAAATISNELVVLRRGFRLAMRQGLIATAPVIEAPRIDNIRLVICTRQQLRLILAALEILDADVHDLVLWLALTGWRSGEARGLLWRDVSEDRGTVVLPAQRSKNRRPRRVALGAAATELLERRWGWRRGEYVFHRAGKPIRIFRGSWSRAVGGAGCPELRPHDLRRLFCQSALDAGVPIPVIQQVAGWQTLSMVTRYGIASGTMQQIALDRVARRLEVE